MRKSKFTESGSMTILGEGKENLPVTDGISLPLPLYRQRYVLPMEDCFSRHVGARAIAGDGPGSRELRQRWMNAELALNNAVFGDVSCRESRAADGALRWTA